jgi:hypothetical protein
MFIVSIFGKALRKLLTTSKHIETDRTSAWCRRWLNCFPAVKRLKKLHPRSDGITCDLGTAQCERVRTFAGLFPGAFWAFALVPSRVRSEDKRFDSPGAAVPANPYALGSSSGNLVLFGYSLAAFGIRPGELQAELFPSHKGTGRRRSE